MWRLGRTLGVGLVALAGCGWAGRPLADDPLLRRGRGVWGDPDRTSVPAPAVEAPPPPVGPTIGADPLDMPARPA